MDIHITSDDTDDTYFSKLGELKSYVQSFKPEFIMYISGTDILEGDPSGNLNISETALIQRDEFVLRLGLENQIPICMLLGGGCKNE